MGHFWRVMFISQGIIHGSSWKSRRIHVAVSESNKLEIWLSAAIEFDVGSGLTELKGTCWAATRYHSSLIISWISGIILVGQARNWADNMQKRPGAATGLVLWWFLEWTPRLQVIIIIIRSWRSQSTNRFYCSRFYFVRWATVLSLRTGYNHRKKTTLRGSDFFRHFCGEMLPPTGPRAEVQLGEDGLVYKNNYRLTQLTQRLKNHDDLQNV